MTARSGGWCLLLMILVLLIPVSASFRDYKIVYDDKEFLTEGVFQVVETDLDNDGVSEIVVAGKNYIGRELFVHWLTVNDQFKPVINWQSTNLFEERSSIWVATGQFTKEGKPQLLVATDTKFYFYEYNQKGMLELVRELPRDYKILSMAVGDIDGDGIDELVVARIGEITTKIYNGYLQAWRLGDSGWKQIAQTALLGNIRSLTVGDLNGDGQAAILVETGLRFDTGTIQLFRLSENKLLEISNLKKPVPGAIYSMKVKKFAEGIRLITGSIRGKVNFFSWNGRSLVKEATEISFSCGLVDVEAADLDYDNTQELYVVGYPQRLMILNR